MKVNIFCAKITNFTGTMPHISKLQELKALRIIPFYELPSIICPFIQKFSKEWLMENLADFCHENITTLSLTIHFLFFEKIF